MTKELFENATQEQSNTMLSVLRTIKDGRVYAKVESVSKSGMSRRINFHRAVLSKESKGCAYIENITCAIAWLSGSVSVGEYYQGRKHLIDNGLLVHGCGMDMIFATLYDCVPDDCSIHYNSL